MLTPLRVLLVEDSDDDADLIAIQLKKAGFAADIRRVETAEAMQSALWQQGWDVIISDYNLPRFSAPLALDLLQQMGLDTPFIVVSGTIGEETALDLMRAGASDYLMKDRLARLGTLIRREMNIMQVRRERKEAYDELRESKERYQRLANNAPDIIFRYDLSPTPHLAYINPAVKLVTGYSPEECCAQPGPLRKMCSAEDGARIDQIIKTKHLPDGPMISRITGKTGETRWIETRMVAVYDDDGVMQSLEGITRDISERRMLDNAHAFLARFSWVETGEDFFKALARFLAQTLEMDYVCIDELVGDTRVAHTLANYMDGQFDDNFTYTLDDTPCGELLGKNVCYFARDVRHRFPRDAALQLLAAESYIGVTLWNAAAQPIGLIAVIGRQPLPHPDLAEAILEMVAGRAAGELERRQAEASLRESEAALRSSEATLRESEATLREREAALRSSEATLRESAAILRESETRYINAFDASSDGLWDRNVITNETHYSPSYWRMLGYEPEMFKGQYSVWKELIHPDDLERTLAANQACIDNQCETFEVEFRMKTRTNGWKWILGRGKAITRDAQGRATRLVGTHIDINERRMVQDALEKRIFALTQPEGETDGIVFEDLFNLDEIQKLQEEFAQATGVASLITRPDGTPITRPSNFCRLCKDIIRRTERGLTNCMKSDALIGDITKNGPTIQPCMSGGLWDAGAGISVGNRHLANWLVGQVRDETQTEAHMRDYAREIGADEDTLVEAFLEVPAMTQTQFEKVARALFTLANQLSAMAYQNVQQARFITSQKQAEEALRDSEARFSNAFEYATIGMTLTSLDGKWLKVNRSICDLLGYSEDELHKMTFEEITHPDDLEPDLELKQQMLRGEINAYQMEKRYIHKSGQTVWVLLGVSLVRDDQGRPLYFIAQIQDITQRRQAEDQVHALHAALEQRVSDRTEQLNAAIQELEAFSYSVSHDLRAPLRALEGFSEILISDHFEQLDNEGRHYLHRIQESTRRMGQLISDLLNLSKITRTEFTRQQVDLSALAHEISADLQAQAGGRVVECAITPDLVVEGDASLLRIMLENLLNNAYKFTSKRERAVIEVGALEAGCERVYFVRDNGAGFNLNYAAQLFAPFQRMHGAKEYPGSGIGLSIVQRIVARHGGRIWAEAAVDQGATFYFLLGK